MSGEVYTEDKLEYTFFPLRQNSITLKVKAGHDAHIALSTVQADDNPLIEILLGGWENSKSAIRYNKEKPNKVEIPTPSLFSESEQKTFMLNWNSEGQINVYFVVDGIIPSEPTLCWKCDNMFEARFFGVRTAWGAQGDWIIDDDTERKVHTIDSMTYTFFPVHHATLDLEVKAKNDAHIALTSGPSDDAPLYEIFLGGWNNTKCAIRYNKEKPDVAEAEGSLNGDEFKKFWVKLSYGNIKVGRDGETEPFMTWKNPEPIAISHYGIRTSYGSDGRWRIKGVEGTVPEGEAETAPPAPAPTEETNEVDSEDREKREVPEVEGVKWVSASNGEVPEGALVGGEDNGNPLYVARAEHNDAILPGKLLADHGVAYIPWGGEEHSKESYEVLVMAEDAVSWVDASGDTIPENAVQGGTSVEGEALYIGRVTHEGALTVGKFHPSHACLYISYGGAEISYPDFQILVKN